MSLRDDKIMADLYDDLNRATSRDDPEQAVEELYRAGVEALDAFDAAAERADREEQERTRVETELRHAQDRILTLDAELEKLREECGDLVASWEWQKKRSAALLARDRRVVEYFKNLGFEEAATLDGMLTGRINVSAEIADVKADAIHDIADMFEKDDPKKRPTIKAVVSRLRYEASKARSRW